MKRVYREYIKGKGERRGVCICRGLPIGLVLIGLHTFQASSDWLSLRQGDNQVTKRRKTRRAHAGGALLGPHPAAIPREMESPTRPEAASLGEASGADSTVPLCTQLAEHLGGSHGCTFHAMLRRPEPPCCMYRWHRAACAQVPPTVRTTLSYAS